MKNVVGTATNEGNIDVSKGKRSKISEASYGVLMDLLSGMYGNASAAVLREYSVNGWDEHQKHGVERPVEVTLPTLLQPTLQVRDFAKGLPQEGTFHHDEQGNVVWDTYGVAQVYGYYGESSKRQTDGEVGGFGIGSKAAFALGHQFMVTSFQNGYMSTSLFALNEDGTSTNTLVHEGPTTEPDGVMVELGVDDIDAMHRNAERFFSFWERGTVLVDGVEPALIFESLERINDEIFIDPDGRGEAYAVMGPVAYPIDRDLLQKVTDYLTKNDLGEAAGLPLRLVDSETDVYIRVPIGGVVAAPNREALRDKATTINALGSVFLGLHQDSQVKVQTEVDAATTFYGAAKALHTLNETLGAFKVDRKSVTWKGQRILKKAAINMRSFTLQNKSWRSDTKVLGIEPSTTLEFEAAEKSLTVVGVSERDQGAVQRFTKRFLEQNEIGVERVFVTAADAVSHGWFQVGIDGGARSVDLTTWREMLKSMRQASPRTVNEPSYTTGFTSASRDLDDRDLLSEILDWGKDIVVFHESAHWLNRFQREALEDYTVVVLLATQSEDALVKRVTAAANDEENPSEVRIVEWDDVNAVAKANAQAVVDSFTDAEKEAAGAKAWLQEHRQTRVQIAKSIKALEYAGEVTSATLLGVEDSFLLAEEFAASVSEDRFHAVAEAISAVSGQRYYKGHGLPEDAVVAYDDTVPDLRVTYPLVDWSDVINAATRLRASKNEDGTWNYSWSFDEESRIWRERMLDHALAYVNSH